MDLYFSVAFLLSAVLMMLAVKHMAGRHSWHQMETPLGCRSTIYGSRVAF